MAGAGAGAGWVREALPNACAMPYLDVKICGVSARAYGAKRYTGLKAWQTYIIISWFIAVRILRFGRKFLLRSENFQGGRKRRGLRRRGGGREREQSSLP